MYKLLEAYCSKEVLLLWFLNVTFCYVRCVYGLEQNTVKPVLRGHPWETRKLAA